MTIKNILSNPQFSLAFVEDFLNTVLPQLRDLGLRIDPEKISLSKEKDGRIWCNMNIYDGDWLEISSSFLTAEHLADLAKLLEKKTFEQQLRDLAPRILAVNWQPADDYVPRHAATETHQAKHFAMEEAMERTGNGGNDSRTSANGGSQIGTANDDPRVDTVNFRTFSGRVISFPVSYAGMIELRNALCRAEALRDLAPYWPYFEQAGWLVTLTDRQAIAHYGAGDHIYNLRPEEIRDLIDSLRKEWDKNHPVPIPFGGTKMVSVAPSADALSADILP